MQRETAELGGGSGGHCRTTPRSFRYSPAPVKGWVSMSIATFVLAVSALTTPVDPFIGTKGDGHMFPGAVYPFGMVQLSPDTQIRYFKQSYPWAAGYQYDDPTILGFSHTHFSGAGHSALGDVLLVPIAGEVRLEPGNAEKPLSGYRSRFSHETEQAQPGYYAVTLSDSGVRP